MKNTRPKLRCLLAPFFPLLFPLLLTLPLGVAAQATAPGTAAAAAPEPTWRLWRSYQVWHDELPDTLPPEQVEIVLLSPDQRCRPPAAGKLFGMSFGPVVDPTTLHFCTALQNHAQAPAPQAAEHPPLPWRLATQALPGRQPAAIVAALEPAPQRRYVALVAWHWREDGRDIFWHFEEAVVDRDTGRWVWHAARTHSVFMFDRKVIAETLPQALQALLRHELPRDLLRRGWWREAVPVPGSRWVPAAEMAAWRPAEGRAGLVFVNDRGTKMSEPFSGGAKLWPAGSAEEPDGPPATDRASLSTRRWPQGIPLMGTRTQALLDLPAGDYLLRLGTEAPQPVRVEAGQITALRLQRQAITAKPVFELEAEARWRENTLPRFRHAFLAEPPPRGAEGLVSWFQP